MKTLYLGNRADDVRTLDDDDKVLLVPSGKSVGSIANINAKNAYRVEAWDGLVCANKYFYYRKVTRGPDKVSYASTEEALAAATAWFEKNNKNTKDTVIECCAKDITDKVAEVFTWVERKIDYPEQEVPLDSRFLGMWLGDGTSRSTEITTIDQEIKDYIDVTAKKYHCTVTLTKNVVPGQCIVDKTQRNNPVRSALRQLNVLNNKHIPDIYMKNSEYVRLEMLAGLLDTDGTIQDNVYDFTQKNTRLANEAMMLARSLGIYATITQRTSYASNTVAKTRYVYNRVYIHMSRFSPNIKMLLAYKQWDQEKQSDSCHGIKITLKKTQDSFRHEWTPELKASLFEVVPKYTTMFGIVQWKALKNGESQFADFSDDAMRIFYSKNTTTRAPDVTAKVQRIKEHFIKVAANHQTAAGKIKWKDLMKDPVFEGVTIQEMRTIMTKLTPEEAQSIKDAKVVNPSTR